MVYEIVFISIYCELIYKKAEKKCLKEEPCEF